MTLMGHGMLGAGRFWLLPWACRACRRNRRRMRRDYLARAARQDALTEMTRPRERMEP